MKNQLVVCIFLLICFIGKAQTKEETGIMIDQNKVKDSVIRIRCSSSVNHNPPLYVVDGVIVPKDSASLFLSTLNLKSIEAIEVISPEKALIYSCYGNKNGVILITTKQTEPICVETQSQELPFKIYKICNTNFNTQQDIYNAITAKVPGVKITNTNLGETPNISMRGDDCAIVIVDGVRYDASILNTINPSDIEKIEVSNNVAASNYLRTKINQ